MNLVHARMIGNPLFGRPEVTTGGNVSLMRRDHDDSEIVILAGYSPVPAGGDGTVVFDMDSGLLETMVRHRLMTGLSASVAVPVAVPVPLPLRLRLNRVKAAFGLSTKELAAVLQCSRAALYNWLDQGYQGQVRDDTLSRLGVLERLAGLWNSYEAGNLAAHLHASVFEHADGERSHLFSLLTDSVIDEERASAALQSIATLSRQQLAEFRRVDDLMARGFGQ
jgi:hypothetical protein